MLSSWSAGCVYSRRRAAVSSLLFSFTDSATTDIYTLSLHDALPISLWTSMFKAFDAAPVSINFSEVYSALQTKIVDRKSTRLNSSHVRISYAVFCLKKKKVILLHASHPGG